eukprot:4675193-Prymnesium_polylepis.1
MPSFPSEEQLLAHLTRYRTRLVHKLAYDIRLMNAVRSCNELCTRGELSRANVEHGNGLQVVAL